MKKILSDLISLKSYSGKEKAIASYIFSFFKDKGANVFMQEGNVVVHIKNNSKTALIFNAHMDTVEVQNILSWNTDPFKLTEADGKYYGLGISDEKVSIAILMDQYEQFLISKIDIFLVFVINEEIDGNGSKIFSEFFKKNYTYSKTYCVICEPRNAKYLGLGNKGNIFFEFHEIGKSSHASEASKGENAITKLISKIGDIYKGFDKFIKINKELGMPSLTYPTVIKGGSSVNTIPDFCVAMGDIRTTPETHDEIKKYIQSFKELKIVSDTMPYINLEKNFVKAFEELGIKDKQYTNGSNDAVFFGAIGIPSIVFGAGNEEACHIANEYCEIKNIEKTKKVYLELVKKLN